MIGMRGEQSSGSSISGKVCKRQRLTTLGRTRFPSLSRKDPRFLESCAILFSKRVNDRLLLESIRQRFRKRLIFETLSIRDLMDRQGFSRFFFPRIDETAGDLLAPRRRGSEERKKETLQR